MYTESDLLPLSALQHLIFCERQCALIHIERAWVENRFTAEGRALHERTHSQQREKRNDKHTERGMPIRSFELGVAGMTDVVEYTGNKVPYPVEYKRGKPKAKNMDEIQLCAEAMCIEEMLGVHIKEGALFYGKTRRRKTVLFTEELRVQTIRAARRLHELLAGGVTPPPVYNEKCRRCSFFDMCKPKLFSKKRNIGQYITRMLEKPLDSDDRQE